MYFVLVASLPDKSMRSMNNKALIKIHKDTFLNHQIKNILKINKQAKLLVVYAFEHKRILENSIKNNRVRYIEHNYDEYSNVGQSIASVIDEIPDNQDVVFINLPVVVDPNVFKNIKPHQSSVIVNSSLRFKSKIGCTIDTKNFIEFVFYDLPNKLCECLYIKGKDLGLFKHIIKNHTKNNMYLFEIINTAITHHLSISAHQVKQNIIHFNNIDQVTNINHLYKKIYNNVSI
jgi:bifunctional N-acetylglucosamine-1-phosphate-uridyltransferase/glucosamine-1-phosphate-acetyltransferase GlmU-like protein